MEVNTNIWWVEKYSPEYFAADSESETDPSCKIGGFRIQDE
jgi:hypothetical protein